MVGAVGRGNASECDYFKTKGTTRKRCNHYEKAHTLNITVIKIKFKNCTYINNDTVSKYYETTRTI